MVYLLIYSNKYCLLNKDDCFLQKTYPEPKNLPQSQNTIPFQETRFKKRNELYDKSCENHKSKISPRNFIFPGQFQTVDSYKLAACLPFKTGSTSWEHLLWEIEHPGKNMSEKTHKMLWTILASQNKIRDENRKIDLFKNRGYSSYTRFLTVRHPLSRLYSGWNEHMMLKEVKDGVWKPKGNQARLFGLKPEEYTETHACSWERFIELFEKSLRHKRRNNIDRHHQPIFKLCMVCDIEYEFLIKQETMDEDSEFVLRSIQNLPKNLHLKKHKMYSKNPYDPYSHLKHYCKFSDEVIERLEDYYKKDYKILGYEKFSREVVCKDKIW